jgi:hypothetical protein
MYQPLPGAKGMPKALQKTKTRKLLGFVDFRQNGEVSGNATRARLCTTPWPEQVQNSMVGAGHVLRWTIEKLYASFSPESE